MYEMNDEKSGSLVHTILVQGCPLVQGLLLALAQNTEYKAPSSFMLHAINRLLSFC